ncbi:MAG TPA: hypothetical protein DCS23_01645 [Candidatus Yonathbacteria bacterium]|nr:hypothetical protein [Candidatus Yonathbacteria bacterium]
MQNIPINNLLQEPKKVTYSTTNDFNPGVVFEIVYDNWYHCPCGKVEIFFKELLMKPYRDRMKMVDSESRCILCKGSLILKKSRGLVASNSNLTNNPTYLDAGNDNIFPKKILNEIRHWVAFLSQKSILISRTRETPYIIEHGGEKFYLDPTIYDVISVWLSCSNLVYPQYIISGPSGIFAYAIGTFLLGSPPGHIFLPRFETPNWEKLLKLDTVELTLLLIGSLNWRDNKVSINLNDLKFIRKNKHNLIESLENISKIEDVLKYNRNVFSLRKHSKIGVTQ